MLENKLEQGATKGTLEFSLCLDQERAVLGKGSSLGELACDNCGKTED